MNGRDALQGSDETPLSQFDIVSGDLIRILTQNNQQEEQASKCDAKKVSEKSNLQTQNHSRASPLSSSSYLDKMSSHGKPSTSQQNDNGERDMDCGPGQSKDSEEAGAINEDVTARVSEPMLCRETTDKAIPLRLRQLLRKWQPTNECEILCIALHVLMLETGFVAKLTQV